VSDKKGEGTQEKVKGGNSCGVGGACEATRIELPWDIAGTRGTFADIPKTSKKWGV